MHTCQCVGECIRLKTPRLEHKFSLLLSLDLFACFTLLFVLLDLLCDTNELLKLSLNVKKVKTPATVFYSYFLSEFFAFELRFNELLPSPGLCLSPSAPGCARHSGKRLGDASAAPQRAPLDAPTPLASTSRPPYPPAPGTLRGDLRNRGEAV